MFKRSLLILSTLLISVNLQASNELDNEIDSLDMTLRSSQPATRYKKVTKKRKTLPSAKTYQAMPTESADEYYQNKSIKLNRPDSDAELTEQNESTSGPTAEYADISGSSYTKGFGSSSKRSNGIIYRITGFGGAAISTFVGNDRAKVIPGSIDNPFSAGPMGSILADINIGSQKFVIETGVQYTQVGSFTGYSSLDQTNTQFSSPYGNGTYDESVLLTYIGLPINAKYFFSSATTSSFYVKAGVLANFLQKIEYSNFGATFLQVERYGGFSKFDAVASGMLGYSMRAFGDFHLVLEAGGFQGTMPISSNFAVYNSGFVTGLGISYIL